MPCHRASRATDSTLAPPASRSVRAGPAGTPWTSGSSAF